jgi:hypothetical protein
MKAAARTKTQQQQSLEAQARAAMRELRAERGALSRLAVKLGISAQAVHLWQLVPIARVLEVERITGISRRRLRPDLFARH